ncbi:hypothetical protein [Kaistella jeonii]|uniref:Uncharacterized protein n=1 Tax=Kaistella jeonii TaxID=266749 RepID=A0A0C1FNX8_9FLAO|nr:hypothetical protein [Kaistella jeonii]KIA89584.1 hypothetical protein OA86_02815 [Kaistella jeonii]SFB90553.1 hypothetical protein SAMN05421876_103337 [Kaistella jeonii]VEI95790.1 Uncharacterised protein [Kaistella jeonii]
MKKIFEIFFEEIPTAELNVERKLEWKMFLPKSTDVIELALLKGLLLFFPIFLVLYFSSIVFAVLFKYHE